MTAVSAAFKADLLAAIPSLRAFACPSLQNADKADDLVQETLVKAWDKHDELPAWHQSQGLAVHHPAQRILFPDAQARAGGAGFGGVDDG
jgi:hypothetical protein